MGRAEDKRQSARDAVAQHGVRAGVPNYLEAAQAFIEARRPEEAVDLLGELLVAQEKKRGLFGRVEKNPLGQSRAAVAAKFAEYARLSAPSEDVLQLLSELSLEFPDDSGIRRANADALYNAGYVADATEEYRYCLRLNPDDGQLLSRLTDAYADMGRNDHAIEYLRRGMRVHAEGNDFGQAMHLAIRWLTMTPGAAEDVLLLLKDWPVDAVRRQLGGLNQLAMLAKKDDTRDAAWHKMVAAEFAAFGASGRPDAVTAQAPAEQPRPAQPQKPAPTVDVKSTAPAGPPPVTAKPAAPPRPFQGITPAAHPQRPTTTAPTPPAPARPTQPHAPAAAQSPTAPPAQQRPTPDVTGSRSLPTIDKLLEEADRRAPAATPPAARPIPPPAARPPTPPAAQVPPSRAQQPTPPPPPPAAQARPPQPPAPPAPVVPPVSKPEPVEAAAPVQTPEQPAHPTAGGTAAGIRNFARRKAKELFDAGDYAEAVQSLERVARFGADSETLQMLLRCYTELNQPENAKRVGMQLADVEVEAGRLEAAVAALTTLAKTVPDPDVLKRRSELISAQK